MIVCVVLRLGNIWSRAVGTVVSLRIGYARVSTKHQNLAVQLDALSGADCDTIYTDTARGSDAARKGLSAALHKCRSGDQFVIWRLDRLSRRLVHLVATVEDLTERGVNVRVLSGRGTHADFSDPEGRFVLGVIASFAQLEHETGAIRTRQALSLKNSSRSRRKALPMAGMRKQLREHFGSVSAHGMRNR
ncbi:recombinase family protein [Rhizobium brockwellii]|uniref:recombinase family protein n=1 Tax=Rhizobium brockwellii TaxID=3019932 RepID=UPI003F9AB69B